MREIDRLQDQLDAANREIDRLREEVGVCQTLLENAYLENK